MIRLVHGDAFEALAGIPNNSIDAVVVDPPYGLEFMGKEWDRLTGPGIRQPSPHDAERTRGTGALVPASYLTRNAPESYVAGPAMQSWHLAWALEALRVLKPGGFLVAFGGTRTYHRLASAVEDAGFEIRDQLQWIYGQGFPKSLDVSKALDAAAGAERPVVGERPLTGTARLKGGQGGATSGLGSELGKERGVEARVTLPITAPATPAAETWEGWGTALKPAHEPIVLARKPLSEPTVADNVLRWGTGALNIGGCRIPHDEQCRMMKAQRRDHRSTWGNIPRPGRTPVLELKPEGRWPANVVLDGEAGGLLDQQNGADHGGASRFFYTSKAGSGERGEFNRHPTVKPVDLMRWLCRLVTPPGGVVLDCFMGSGSTGVAALAEGFSFIGVEREAEYFAIAERRIAKASPEPLQRKAPKDVEEAQTDLFVDPPASES